MTRTEHVAWAKGRALAYVDCGDVSQAYDSLASDLAKHPETAEHPALILGLYELMLGHLFTPEAMRKFINGFA